MTRPLSLYGQSSPLSEPSHDGGPNYSQHIGPPIDWARGALLTVTVLVEVYSAREHHELRLSVSPHEHL